MKSLVKSLLSLLIVTFAGATVSLAAGGGEDGETAHYPIKKPGYVDWSFAGPFGHYDKGQLQRGLKVYIEVCAACHSMDLVAFRTLEDLGYSEAQVKALAAEYEVEDGPDAEGEMFTRAAIGSDYFPSPFPNKEAAAYANNGAVPPDFSLLAKARGVERGFPTFIFDIFTMYAENGPDYIHALLTGYEDAPAGVEVLEGTYYNPYFIAGSALAMANPLDDGLVTYDDGAPETVDQYAQDVSAFLMWAAEPHLDDRKRLGFMVLIFLIVFSGLLYLTKKSVYSNLEH